MTKRGWVAIIGGACAGSEMASQFVENGFQVAVFEQNELPYGKIEDGLPKWHDKLRLKEMGRIDGKLDQDGVFFVPQTKIGQDISMQELIDLGFQLIVMANGAWRDRPLRVKNLEEIKDDSFVYQNPLIYWYNHQDDANFDGKTYSVPDGTAIIGGGLASIDVAKICQFEQIIAKLKERNITCTDLQLEHYGHEKVLAEHDLTLADLNIKPATLFYRRRVMDMPLYPMPDNPSEAIIEKAKGIREKIINNAKKKFGFEVVDCVSPVSLTCENGSLKSIQFKRNKVSDGKLETTDETFEVETSFLVSSIGSIPQPIPGVPMVGELYKAREKFTGRIDDLPRVCCTGNAITGKGNIQASMKSASQLAKALLSGLDIAESEFEEYIQNITEEAQNQVKELIGYLQTLPQPKENILPWVQKRQAEIGLDSYRAWCDAHLNARQA